MCDDEHFIKSSTYKTLLAAFFMSFVDVNSTYPVLPLSDSKDKPKSEQWNNFDQYPPSVRQLYASPCFLRSRTFVPSPLRLM